MKEDINNRCFLQATECLCAPLRDALRSLPPNQQSSITEIRLRNSMPVVLTCAEGALFVYSSRLSPVYSQGAVKVSAEQLEETFKRICGYSVHSHRTSINSGYITVEGGHRAGVCGTAMREGESVCSVRDINCINIRIAKQIKGSANGVYSALFAHSLPGVIIAGAPSSGKTTLLRDLARQLSGEQRGKFIRTVICDERGEIAAVHNGVPANDVGINCDVLTSYPKGEGIMIALRSFSPQVIICDETGCEEEIKAIESGVNSGVSFIVSVHASSRKELCSKLQIRRLIETGAFSDVVLLNASDRSEKYFKAKELYNEIRGGDADCCGIGNAWQIRGNASEG